VETITPAEMKTIARRIEELGFDWITISEHIVVDHESAAEMGDRWVHSLAAAGFIFGVTDTIKVTPLICVPYHNPLELAKTNDRSTLSEMLGAEIPSNWPPPLNDDASAKFFADYLEAHPGAVGWVIWYFILQKPRRIVIGNGGFKGTPHDGTVETGYSIVPEFQSQGYGSEAVGALIEWAFSHPDVRRVIAETLPELDASQALLRKLGFRAAAGASEPGVLRFEKLRSGSGVSQ